MEAINAFIAQYGALMAQGTWDAIVMTVLSTLFAYVIGIPVGVLLVLTEPGGLHPHRIFNSVLGWIVNIMRSVHHPYRVHDSVHARHRRHFAWRGRGYRAAHRVGCTLRCSHG